MLSSMFKASAITELRFFSKGNVWSVIVSSYLAVLGIYSIRQKFSYIRLVYRKWSFKMELILMNNINKTTKKIENVNDDGNKWDNEKLVFKSDFSSDRFMFL